MLGKGLRVAHGKEWVLEKVLGQRFVDGNREYLVQWGGSQWPDMWHPAEDLRGTADEAIDAFVKRSAGGPCQSRKKKRPSDGA